jgi:hypothetical protein
MNIYKKAIEKNEVICFLRGNGEYFEKDRDREGKHDYSFTTFHIMGYALEINESIFFDQLNKNLLEYISLNDFNIQDSRNILSIIWVYCLFKDENKIHSNWIIDKNVIKKILDNSKNEEIKDIIDRLRSRFNFNIVVSSFS